MSLIIVILLITITVNSSYAINSKDTQTSTAQEYNFENMSIGSFPSNTSWISFNVVNPVGGTDISIKNINGLNALNIFSLNEEALSNQKSGNDTFLSMNFTGFQYRSVTMNMTYSENNTGGANNNRFIFISNGSRLAEIKFSSGENLTEVFTSHESVIGPKIDPDEVYRFTISYENGYISLQISKGSTGMPIEIPIKAMGSDLEIMIGSEAVNLSIYNLTVSDEISSTSVLSSNFNESMFTLPLGTEGSMQLDRCLNSVIFTNNKGIVIYNYKNKSEYEIFNHSSEFSSSYVYNGFLYSYFFNGSSMMVKLNLSDLKSSITEFDYSPKSCMNMIVSSAGIYLYNTSTIVSVKKEISYCNTKSFGSLFAVSGFENTDFYFYNNSARYFHEISFNSTASFLTA
ncbi:MAG: hypothetical protein ACP5UV_05100, partial [Thermoplasmata archaeon]